MHDLLSTLELSADMLDRLVERALAFKSGAISERSLSGQSVALVFLDPSLRTRTSMQVAIYELGGNPIVIEPGTSSWTIEFEENVVMDAGKTEHLKEFVRVLERYVSIIGVRCFAELRDWQSERLDPVLNGFARYASIPVINLESAMHHPCQALTDMMTIREKLGGGRKRVLLTWAWHPKALPMAVPNSFALAAAQFGHDLTIAHPPEYDLDGELMDKILDHSRAAGGRVTTTHDLEAAYDSADVVSAKSWGASKFYGKAEAEIENRLPLRDLWIVDETKMSRTADAIFMHCLPVRRNVVVTDDVIDSPESVVIDEAENRLHMQKAVLAEIMR